MASLGASGRLAATAARSAAAARLKSAASDSAAIAALIRADPRRVSVEEWPLGPLGPREVLVRPHVVGVCHSDLELLDGNLDSWLEVNYPLVFGHEWSGEVLTVGADVGNVAPGDRVTGCAALGENRWFGTTTNGAAAERFIAPARLLYPIPPQLSYARAALIEPFACAYQGIRAIGGADPGETVCIVGAGTIGLCALAAIKALGARTLVVDPSSERRTIAQDLGGDAVLDPKGEDDLGRAAASLLGGTRPDLVIEAAGAARALSSALELAGDGGRVLFLGLCPDPIIPAALRLIQQRNLRLLGSTGAPPEIWPRAVRFVAQSGVDLSPLVTATFPLAQAADAFDAARDVSSNLKVHIHI